MAPTSQPLEPVPNIKPDATATAVFAEQVRLLYRFSLSTYGVTLAVALIVTCGLWNVAPNALLAAWFAGIAAITAARFALHRTVARHSANCV